MLARSCDIAGITVNKLILKGDYNMNCPTIVLTFSIYVLTRVAPGLHRAQSVSRMHSPTTVSTPNYRLKLKRLYATHAFQVFRGTRT